MNLEICHYYFLLAIEETNLFLKAFVTAVW